MEAETLTYEECLAWAERYSSTAWNMLALSTAADGQPSPTLVMRSLFAEADRAREGREQNCDLYRQATVRLAEVGKAAQDLIDTWEVSADALGPEWAALGERITALANAMRPPASLACPGGPDA